MKTIQVYINKSKGKGRELVNAELIKTSKTTVIVKLPDGHVVVRKKERDLIKEKL